MECHEGTTMIKTFRGMITDGGEDTLVLHTNDGSTGYRIIKFEILPQAPIASEIEAVVKIFKVAQTSFSSTVDFNDNTLLGVGVWWGGSTGVDDPQDKITIFDREIFNQDIFISGSFSGGTFQVNYYIELEQIKLDLSESTVATLKDIRNELRIAPG